ncbi:hypothetical protein BDBG_17116 [Blastomyces gilchristii SLH14081]|uniref:Uncharacterized protein n=1 Tax=Blastomyces gilchristii (strain SLH14081) TaxID=559298 RepID=A0A179UL76_BLAGS|nr:uncharacterized protein BDBG_17116 [Blastomyces gilchristii SLH14081]OAT08826.1 hypothetical protein BDBG_17116 [Blastomyces gilchristii SLH14081]
MQNSGQALLGFALQTNCIRKSGLRVVRETAPSRVAGEVQNGGGGATAGLWGVVLVFDEGATQRKAGGENERPVAEVENRGDHQR